MSKPYIEVPLFRQERAYSCLPACVRMVLAFHDSEHAEAELRVLFKTKLGGTSPAKVMLEVPPLGFDARVWSASLLELRELIEQGTPCIVSVWTGDVKGWGVEGMHSVVVVGFGDDAVLVNDPAHEEAPKEVPLDEFTTAWGTADQVVMAIVRRQG
ncbi:MAG: C39 family peptidase [Chloroflexi bacterium]|nr:C39 family peptidase [Chloroflexota bacterium]